MHADSTKTSDCETRIDGLTFHFNDGGELYSRKCESMGHRVLIRLEKGEHITVAVALWKFHDGGCGSHTVKWLMGIRLETSTGRTLKVKPKRTYPLDLYEEKSHVADGHVLRSIKMVPLRSDWDMDKQRMFEIETVPIETSHTIPSLA